MLFRSTAGIAAVVDGAPEDLNTLKEIAAYAEANRGITDQLNAAIGGKADKTHTHSQSQVTGLTTALNGKANATHTHTTSDITDFATEMGKKANSSHTHTQAQVSGLSTALGGKADKAHTHDLSTLPGRISNEQAPDVTIIGSGVDLNTYETTGVFSQNMNVYAAAGTNYPVDRAGLLEVAKSSGMTYQTYTVYNSGAMYYRGRYSQSWGAWKEVSTEGHTHTTSQISGLGTALNGKADKTYVDSRPALFSGVGAPPSSIPGAVAGDFWLDESTKELHKITGV